MGGGAGGGGMNAGLASTTGSGTLNKKDKDSKKKDNTKKILPKEDDTPFDFRHVGHVGWDPDNGFDVCHRPPLVEEIRKNKNQPPAGGGGGPSRPLPTVPSGQAPMTHHQPPLPPGPPGNRIKLQGSRDVSTAISHLGNDSACSNTSVFDDAPDICVFHLRSKCNYSLSCRNYHSKQGVPYQWQYKYDTGYWMDFDSLSQTNIEIAFCKPENTDAYIITDERYVKVNFLKMKFYLAPDHSRSKLLELGNVRRLSTKSTVVTSSVHQFSTLWRWYCECDNNVWIEFEQNADEEKVSGGLSSENIEELFSSGYTSVMSFERHFMHYELDLKDMTQTNTDTKTVRQIRRRPEEFDPVTKQPVLRDILRIKDLSIDNKTSSVSAKIPLTTPTIYPGEWSDHSDNNFFQIVQIQPAGLTKDEYAGIVKLFGTTMTDPVKTIRRIQNVELWDAFYRKKSWMERKLQAPAGTAARIQQLGKVPDGSASSVNIKHLFHGTKRALVDAICRQGFDWRLNGSAVGTLYGKGSYFAKKAKYSADYTDARTLFLVRVLVGEYAKGDKTMVRPPPKNPTKPLDDLYDSCVDNVADPNIFVVFTQEQAYPEYIIEY